MRLLHLSDVHLASSRLLDFKQYYLKALLNDIKKENEIERIDLVAVTGDLVHQGGGSFAPNDPYAVFETAFVEPLRQVLPVSVPLLFCPGNHDLDLQKLDAIYEAGLEKVLVDNESINSFIDQHRQSSHPGLGKQAAFQSFVRRQAIPSVIASYQTNFENCFVFNIGKLRVGVACFNSSWRCSPNLPIGSYCFGSRQILNASQFFKENKVGLRIAMLHHSPALLMLQEKREVLSFLHDNEFDLALCGHAHNADMDASIGPQGDLFFVTARTAFSNPRDPVAKDSPGYVIVRVDLPENSAKCMFRKYVHSRVQFDKDVDAAADGEQDFPLKTLQDRPGLHRLQVLVKKTYQARVDEIDAGLVVYGTDTVAPKRLEDLFTMPVLTNAPPAFAGSSKVIYARIADLITENVRSVIVGPKESGKTTLLNKIFCELCEDFHSYGRVPVFIHFTDINGKRIITLIQRFLNETLTYVKQLLNDGAVAVLVDDFVVSDDDSSVRAIEQLTTFLEEYPKTVLVCTTSEAFDILLLSGEHFFRKYDIRPIYVDYIKAEQFRELAQKWFKKKDQEWINKNIEKLIKTFGILRIPHTFFSISLFLWIIEKQADFRPFNQAVLIDTFLNYILEGLRLENSKAGSYNYDRRIELLSEIALRMYECGDRMSDYCLQESEALRCIEENFRLNQRSWDPGEKLQEFLAKGVLLRKNKRIIFHFESFFQYLLSINIDKRQDFKKKVFESGNMLSFIDEIDFYTGRNQTDKGTLRKVFALLDQSFGSIDKMFPHDVDGYLPQSSRLVREIDEADFLTRARQEKLSDEGIEKVLSEQFDSLPVSTTIRAKERVEDARRFHGALALAARVLKNSENIKDPDLINRYLEVLLRRSARYGLYIQSIILQEMRKNFQGTFPILDDIVGMLAPLINQMLLLSWLGTDFIELPLAGYLDRRLKARAFENYQSFLAVSIYADMHFPDSIRMLKRVIDRIDNPFVAEILLMKVLIYYQFSPSKSSVLPELESLMGKLLVKSRGIKRSSARRIVSKILGTWKGDETTSGRMRFRLKRPRSPTWSGQG